MNRHQCRARASGGGRFQAYDRDAFGEARLMLAGTSPRQAGWPSERLLELAAVARRQQAAHAAQRPRQLLAFIGLNRADGPIVTSGRRAERGRPSRDTCGKTGLSHAS